LLYIVLKREIPEQMKPRRIEIADSPANDWRAGHLEEAAA